MEKATLITGGAGAIGSNLADALSRAGKPVIILDDLSSGRLDNVPKRPLIRFVRGSVASDEDLRRAFDRPVGAVFHLAASFANLKSVRHPERDLQVNGMGTLKVLLHATRGKVERFIYASSSSVYESSEGPLDEASRRFSTDTPYAISKLLGESYVRYIARSTGLKTVILRYFNVYGPGEYPGPYRNVIANFVLKALRGEDIEITGTGEETRDFNYVEDVVEATLRAADRQEAVGRVLNIGSGRETSIRRLAELIIGGTASRSQIRCVKRRAWDPVTRRCARVELARALLGYEPRTGLTEGLGRYGEWLKRKCPSELAAG